MLHSPRLEERRLVALFVEGISYTCTHRKQLGSHLLNCVGMVIIVVAFAVMVSPGPEVTVRTAFLIHRLLVGYSSC